jgi:hypothetical protein
MKTTIGCMTPHYLTDTQVDAAAEIIEEHVRSVLTFGGLRYLGDACVEAACAVQRAWGFGYRCQEDPSLNEEPVTT